MTAEVSYREYGSPERYSRAFGGSVERLPEGWVCGRKCDIGGEPGRPVRMDLVLMHPGLGVALIDCEEPTEGAEGVLRERLEEARFEAIFGGYLPVVHGRIGINELPSITELTRAFGELPPLTVAGGNAWLSVVARVVIPIDRTWADNLQGAPNRQREVPGVGPAPMDGRPYGRAATVVPLRRVASVREAGTAADGDEPEGERPWTRWASAAAALARMRLWLASASAPRWAAAGLGLLSVTVLAVAWLGSDFTEPSTEAPVAMPTQKKGEEPIPSPMAQEVPAATLAAPSASPLMMPPPPASSEAGAPRPPAAVPVVRRATRPPHLVRPVRERPAAARKLERPSRSATRPQGRN